MSDWEGQEIELDEDDDELVESKPRSSSPMKQCYWRDCEDLVQLDNDNAESGSGAALAHELGCTAQAVSSFRASLQKAEAGSCTRASIPHSPCSGHAIETAAALASLV